MTRIAPAEATTLQGAVRGSGADHALMPVLFTGTSHGKRLTGGATVDRESEPGDPAKAEPTWFDTPGEGDQLWEPTWFDDPTPAAVVAPRASRKGLSGQDRPDPVNAGFLARAVGALVDPQRAAAVLADVLRDGSLPEPKASEVYWKLAGLTPPTRDRPYATRIATPLRAAGGRPKGSGCLIADLDHLVGEIRRVKVKLGHVPTPAELCKGFRSTDQTLTISRDTLKRFLVREELTWRQVRDLALT